MSTRKSPILKGFPKETIQLGILISDLTCPDQDATEPPKLEKEDISNIKEIDPRTFYQSNNGIAVGSQFTKFLSLSHSHGDGGATELSAAQGRIYRLKKPDDIFARLCNDEPVKRWLERRIKQNKKAYFIVGTQTYFDTTYEYGGQKGSTSSAKARLPATETTIGTPIGYALDVSLEGQHQYAAGGHGISYMPGEYVFDICYRRIAFKFSWYQPSAVATANLGGNRWKAVSGSRGEQGTGFEVVEATLDESTPSQVREVRHRFSDKEAFAVA